LNANLEELEQALGYTFRDRALLVRALTHSSSANEAMGAGAPPDGNPRDNERLEFLGDSVLGWIVSEWLFQQFRDFNEGQLSLLKNHLVSANHLLPVAHRLDLGRFLHLGRGEETGGGRSKQRLLVNALEAVLAAVYLDSGVSDPVKDILLRHAMPELDELAKLAGAGPPHDYRAELDRITRERSLPRPEYVLIGESGPGHARVFTMQVRVGRDLAVQGEGSSKKIAAHNAARDLRQLLG